MGTIWVRELTGGLDTRRMPETTKGGALMRAVDGHINRGGEFEQRAAFVLAYTLPTGTTKGLAAGKRSLTVFGDTVALGIPVGIAYQRLQHPDSTTALTGIASTDLYAGLIYAIGTFADGGQYHFYDGTRVADWVDGRARSTFAVSGSAGGVLSGITVAGVAIIIESVAWADSNEATAAAVATAINDFSSTPEFTATVNGANISVMAAATGTAANGQTVAFVTTGDFTLTPSTGTMASGAAVVTDDFQSGLFARTVGSKVYALTGPFLNFSGVEEPTLWDSGTTGAGFIDLSLQSSGAEDLQGFGKYLQYIAIFAARVIQLWYVDPDPTLNKISQTLLNTGTESPRTITQFGDSDLFYLDSSGVRSLRARNSSLAAATSDIGIPVDTLIKAKLAALTPFQRSKVIGLIEPTDGRFWLIFSDEIFVFSYFPGSKVSAWSTYLPTAEVDGARVAFTINDAAVFKGKVYIRSTDDKVYVYGGRGATLTYDTTAPEIWLPYLDGDRPTMQKHFEGFDAACEGQWEVKIAMQPKDQDAFDIVGNVVGTTFNLDKVPGEGSSSHFSVRLRGIGSGAKKVSSLVIHYTADDEED